MSNKRKLTIDIKDFLKFLSDKSYIKLYYFAKFGKFPNLAKPRSFNEKIQIYKLKYRDSQMPLLVDKYEVRNYISQVVGDEYLVDLYGVYQTFEEIDFTQLPEKFVIKCTHDSQSAVVCSDRSTFNIEETKDLLNRALKRDWYWQGREWAYKGLTPKIVVEQFLEEPGKITPNDYKFYCFDGEVKLIQVDSDRFSSNHKRQYFSAEWDSLGDWDYYNISDAELLNKPDNLHEMIMLSKKLSKPFPHVRVDWYSIEGKIYFGELTFYTGGGFGPFHAKEDKNNDQLDLSLGDCFVI